MRLFGRLKEPQEEHIEQTPIQRLAGEVDRLRLIKGNEKSRMNPEYMLYVPSDEHIPYVNDGLKENEILVSNAMGELEFYHYRLLEDGTVVAVWEENGTETLETINGDLAANHADFLAGFGQDFVEAA